MKGKDSLFKETSWQKKGCLFAQTAVFKKQNPMTPKKSHNLLRLLAPRGFHAWSHAMLKDGWDMGQQIMHVRSCMWKNLQNASFLRVESCNALEDLIP